MTGADAASPGWLQITADLFAFMDVFYKGSLPSRCYGYSDTAKVINGETITVDFPSCPPGMVMQSGSIPSYPNCTATEPGFVTTIWNQTTQEPCPIGTCVVCWADHHGAACGGAWQPASGP